MNKVSQKRSKSRRNGKKNVLADSPIPAVWRAVFRWPFYNTLSAAAGLTATYGFRLNGMFDPDFTGIGNQPSYFDQFSGMYTKYRVTGATVRFKIYNISTSPVAVVVIATTRNSGVINLIGDAVVKNADFGCLAPNGSGGSGWSFTKSYSVAKIWGVTENTVRSEDDFAAITSGNPNNVIYLWIGARAVDGSAFNIGYTLEIDYQSEMHMPITVGPS